MPSLAPWLSSLIVAALLALACSSAPPPDARVIPSQLPAAERDAARRLPLSGAHNFRDLGGYANSDGQRTRWGVLFRSDMLAELSDDDLAYLSRLGLRRVIDFRSERERERDPDRIPQGAAVELLPIEGEGLDPAQIREMITQGGEAEAVEVLTVGNRAFVREFTPQYRAFLTSLADADSLPTLFHCTAGKDRAGFAAALALLAVGVPRETVMQDYLLTREYSAEAVESRVRQVRWMSLWSIDPAGVRALSDARREYLQAAFDTIDADYGGTEAYLRDGLGIDDATLARIRANLLE